MGDVRRDPVKRRQYDVGHAGPDHQRDLGAARNGRPRKDAADAGGACRASEEVYKAFFEKGTYSDPFSVLFSGRDDEDGFSAFIGNARASVPRTRARSWRAATDPSGSRFRARDGGGGHHTSFRQDTSGHEDFGAGG